jgi:phenylpyruvate tautomerase PptA (4-oxalocrotonate tautomerase family)
MRRIIYTFAILMVFCSILRPGAVGVGKRIVLMPFYDESGYRGPWKLKVEVPVMLGDMLQDEYYRIVPIDSVIAVMEKPKPQGFFRKITGVFMNRKERQRIMTDGEVLAIARKLDGDIVITGFIEDYNYRRMGGGEPMIGGYKSYNAKVGVDQVRILNVANGQQMGRAIKADDNKTDRGLGLELFGKERKRDYEFYSLDSLDFGSKRFLVTLIGQATVEALNKAQKEIRVVISLPDTNWYSYKKFRVLLVEQGVATINAGSGDGVKAGDRFRVYTSDSGVPVGKISITTIWSEHLSKAEILEGKDEIRQKDVIMPDVGK